MSSCHHLSYGSFHQEMEKEESEGQDFRGVHCPGVVESSAEREKIETIGIFESLIGTDICYASRATNT